MKSQIEKLNKQKRSIINKTCNRLRMDFSFGHIKTWQDIYRITGYDTEYISRTFETEQPKQSVTIADINSWCKKLHDELESSISGVVPYMPAEVPKVVEKIAEPPHFQTAEEVSTPTDESGFNNSNDYGLQPSPHEKAYLFWFQKKATKELFDKIVVQKKPAVLLLASTGTGKTFITAALDRRLKDINFEKDKTWGTTNYLSITRASVVEQTKRVNKNFFGIKHPVDTEVINIEQLRSRAGQLWIINKTTIVNGEEVEVWVWKPMINPSVLYLDECQAVKNEGSQQHKILVAYSELRVPTTQVFISATPFTRVSEAKAFAIATKKDISHLGFPPGTKLSAATWPTYASIMAGPQSVPTDYNEAAVDRLMDDLSDYIVRVRGVRWQFNAINRVEVIDFDSAELRKEYDQAWERYLIKKAKLEESVTDNPRFQELVELQIFLAAAEYCKRYIFARRMYNDVMDGKAAVLAVKFKKTLIAVVKILHDDYGISRDSISLIWGGGQTQLTAKQKLKTKVMENFELFKAQGISLEDMMLEDVEERILEDLPPELRLGSQSKEERQREIDRFQSGKSLYCIYTYKAGGVGLSLHHTDEQVSYKVRRQKNGYAVIEDIPNIPTRPRKATVGPTWSAIELVQGCGRVPRLTSLSDTEQCFLYYRGTVEEDQAYVVTHKLKCLSKVVRQHENWMDIIENHSKARELAREKVATTSKYETEEQQTETGEEPEGNGD